MAVRKNTPELELDKDGIALMTVKVTNKILPAQPHVTNVFVGEPTAIEASGSDELRNIRRFVVDRAHRASTNKANQYEEYLISMRLEPGRYSVQDVWMSSKLGIHRGGGRAPLNARFEVKPKEVTYLGHVSIVRRSKKCHEFAAGQAIPLISQAALGWSTGTYDIDVLDNYDRDMSQFKQMFPVLKNHTIAKAVLAPWKRPVESDPASCTESPDGAPLSES
jgi:hypothetical protein